MAICSSSIGLSKFCNPNPNGGFGSSSSNDHGVMMIGEVRAFRRPTIGIGCNSSFGRGSSLRANGKHIHRFEIRSMLQQQQQQPNNESKSSTIDFTLVVNNKNPSSPPPPQEKVSRVVVAAAEDVVKLQTDDFNGGGGSFDDGNKDGNGGGGGGKGGGGGGDDNDNEEDNSEEEEAEFGPIMKFEDVIKETEARGASLPPDMLEAAKTVGIRRGLLLRYLDLQGSGWLLGFLMKSFSWLRNRMLADPTFLFKVGTEVVIDSCCATFAEVQKRGENFWAEFELFVADLLVGVVVDIALVGLLAPYVRIGQPAISKGFLGQMKRAYGTLPSSVFEAERPGSRFSVQQRVATYFSKGVLYGSVGFGCGLIGQGIANMIMTAKRSIKHSEDDIPVPPLVKSAALWGVFLAVSSNTRYQIINGLERVVEASPLTKQVPPIALAFTVGVRFANNIYGGMQFVDWARLSGCQ